MEKYVARKGGYQGMNSTVALDRIDIFTKPVLGEFRKFKIYGDWLEQVLKLGYVRGTMKYRLVITFLFF